MTSIFDLPLQESGGPDAIASFEYQHRIATLELFRIVEKTDCIHIEFDSHDDILVSTTNGPRFIQVKANSLGLWTPSNLYTNEKSSSKQATKGSTSIIARQLMRARGDDLNVSFKLVTKAETNDELSILKINASERSQKPLDALKFKINNQLNHLSFPKNRTSSDWIDLMQWQVEGPTEAVDGKNFRLIAEIFHKFFERTLTPEQIETIYEKSLTLIRHASATRSLEDKRCSRKDLLSWLGKLNDITPHHLSKNQQNFLSLKIAETRERCVSRWMSAGVPLCNAENLASNLALGKKNTTWTQSHSENFLWIKAQFGAGKSYTLDQAYLEALKNFQVGSETKFPILIEAKYIQAPLIEEITSRLNEAGIQQLQAIHIFIDGADELSQSKARNLLREAYSLSRVRLNSRTIITSSILEVEGIPFKSLPSLSEEDTRIIAAELAPHKNIFDQRLDLKFRNDFSNPFFLIQRLQFGAGISRADLIDKLVKTAIKKNEDSISEIENVLIDLACWKLNNSNPLIPEKAVGLSIKSLRAALETRILEKKGDNLTFTVECISHWLASRALLDNRIEIESLTNTPQLLNKWQFAVSLAISQGSLDFLDSTLSILAKTNPAFASLVLIDASSSNWGPRNSALKIQDTILSQRLNLAMSSWKEGLEPISSDPSCFPVDSQGKILEATANSSEGTYHIKWLLPPGKRGKSEFDYVTYWGGAISEDSSWVWKMTHGHIKANFDKLLRENNLQYFSHRLKTEAFWDEACKYARVKHFTHDAISLQSIKNSYKPGLNFPRELHGFKNELNNLLGSGATSIEAPYPQGDAIGAFNWPFSLNQALRREIAIYETAVLAYRECAENLFPRMKERLPRYATYPYSLRGVVYDDEGHCLAYVIHSEPTNPESTVQFRAGTKNEVAEVFSALDNPPANTSPSWSLRMATDGIISPYEARPAAKIVSDWLRSDLRSIGWL